MSDNTVITDTKETGWVKIPKEICQDPTLGMTDRVILSVIVGMFKSTGVVYLLNEDFADMLAIGIDTVKKAIPRLERHGYIKISTQKFKRRNGKSYTNRILIPVSLDEITTKAKSSAVYALKSSAVYALKSSAEAKSSAVYALKSSAELPKVECQIAQSRVPNCTKLSAVYAHPTNKTVNDTGKRKRKEREEKDSGVSLSSFPRTVTGAGETVEVGESPVIPLDEVGGVGVPSETLSVRTATGPNVPMTVTGLAQWCQNFMGQLASYSVNRTWVRQQKDAPDLVTQLRPVAAAPVPPSDVTAAVALAATLMPDTLTGDDDDLVKAMLRGTFATAENRSKAFEVTSSSTVLRLGALTHWMSGTLFAERADPSYRLPAPVTGSPVPELAATIRALCAALSPVYATEAWESCYAEASAHCQSLGTDAETLVHLAITLAGSAPVPWSLCAVTAADVAGFASLYRLDRVAAWTGGASHKTVDNPYGQEYGGIFTACTGRQIVEWVLRVDGQHVAKALPCATCLRCAAGELRAIPEIATVLGRGTATAEYWATQLEALIDPTLPDIEPMRFPSCGYNSGDPNALPSYIRCPYDKGLRSTDAQQDEDQKAPFVKNIPPVYANTPPPKYVHPVFREDYQIAGAPDALGGVPVLDMNADKGAPLPTPPRPL